MTLIFLFYTLFNINHNQRKIKMLFENSILHELDNFSIFYVRKNIDEKNIFQNIKDSDGNFYKGIQYKKFEFNECGYEIKAEFIYNEHHLNKKNPDWLTFINEKINQEEKIKNFSNENVFPRGVLKLKIGEETILLNFGLGALGYINKTILISDFGIITAMNMCALDRITKLKTATFQSNPLSSSKQIAHPTTMYDFNLESRDLLNSLSSTYQINGIDIIVAGEDKILIKTPKDGKFNWQELIDVILILIKNYKKKDYIQKFPNYNLRKAKSIEIKGLNNILEEKLKQNDFSDISFAIPEFLDDIYQFTYDIKENKKKSFNYSIFSFLDSSDINQSDYLKGKKISTLKNRQISAILNDRITDFSWSFFEIIYFETRYKEEDFVLYGGNWFKIYKKLSNEIDTYIEENINDKTSYNNNYKEKTISSEDDFIKLIENSNSDQYIKFHRSKFSIAESNHFYEFCDLLKYNDNKKLDIIQIKIFNGKGAIQEVFSQTCFYGDYFLDDQDLLNQVRSSIKDNKNINSLLKDNVLNILPENIDRNYGLLYNLKIWFICGSKKDLKKDLTVMQKFYLKQSFEKLRRHKFNSLEIVFIPVNLINLKKIKSTKKK